MSRYSRFFLLFITIDADILVLRSFRMTCNGGSTAGIYSLIFRHIQPTTSSGSRGLLSRITGSTETISSLKVDDADDFDGIWYFVFEDRQHMQITLSDILNGSKTIDVISQDVQLIQNSGKERVTSKTLSKVLLLSRIFRK